MRFWPAEGAATGAVGSEAEEGAVALVTVAAVTAGRLPVAVAVAVAGVERFAAATIVVVLDGKATSVFPDRSTRKLFASVRAA